MRCAAAALPVPTPDSLALKDPKDFTLIGTPAKRLDRPDKVNCHAEFGIDTKQPGMKVAACCQNEGQMCEFPVNFPC